MQVQTRRIFAILSADRFVWNQRIYIFEEDLLMKKVLSLSILFLVLCAAACLAAHAEDMEESGILFRDGFEVLSYGDYAYILEDGQAAIVGFVDYEIDGDCVYIYLYPGEEVISTASSFQDCPGVTDESARLPGNINSDTPQPLAIPSQLNGYPVVAIRDSAFLETLYTGYIIPEGVVSIGDYAFAYCYYFDTIVIPNSVASIGEGAFQNCEQLETVVIPDSVTFIGDGAFGWDYDGSFFGSFVVAKGSYAEKFAQENGYSYLYSESSGSFEGNADELIGAWRTAEDDGGFITLLLYPADAFRLYQYNKDDGETFMLEGVRVVIGDAIIVSDIQLGILDSNGVYTQTGDIDTLRFTFSLDLAGAPALALTNEPGDTITFFPVDLDSPG